MSSDLVLITGCFSARATLKTVPAPKIVAHPRSIVLPQRLPTWCCIIWDYAWRERGTSLRQQEHERRIPLVREIHRVSKGTYGTRRMAEELEAHGNSCGRSRARTLMNLAQVSVRRRRKFKATTDSRHNLPVAPNLLDREFEAKEPNRVWASDITYIWTAGGWLYLAVILDLFSRQVVGWSMNNFDYHSFSAKVSSLAGIGGVRTAMWAKRGTMLSRSKRRLKRY
jgi:hypothetical protein